MAMTTFERINAEAVQSPVLRVNLLRKMEKVFERRVVSFYTSFDSIQGAISDQDVEMIRDILCATNGRKLLLIIDSPGGDPLAAERIIKVCREMSHNDYWVLIPGMAKSAATMISLGASKMVMTNTSELGPIDIQVPWGADLIPAHVIISSYEELVEQGTKLPAYERIEPIIQQLQVFNAPQIAKLKLSRDLAYDIALKVLKEGIFQNVPDDEAMQLLGNFINPQELKAHGRPVFYSDILEIDKGKRFNVDCIAPNAPLYDILYEYHTRVKFHMQSQGLAKLFETEKSGFFMPIRTGGV